MVDVTIPDLPNGVTLVGTEPLETVQAGVSVQVPTRFLGLATDPVITVSSVGQLTNSRTLTAGTGVSLIDNGAGGTLVINSTGIVVSTASFVLLSADPDLPNERVLTGTANQVVVTDNGAGSTVVLSTPQSIAPASSPTFAGITLTSLTGLLQGNGVSAVTAITNSSTVGQVLRVTGAATYAWGAVDLADSDAVTGILPVPNGGTGVGTLTGLAQGNGTGVFTAVTNSSTVGQVLRVTGAATYAWGAVDLSDTDAITGTLPATNGGTSFSTYALGDTIYASAANTLSKLPGNITAGAQFLAQTGTGAVSAAPVWTTLPGSFTGFANPSASIGLTAVNGVATTAMRSDAAPLLSQAIIPTWTGLHTFTGPLSGVATTGVLLGSRSSLAAQWFVRSAAAADNRIWETINLSGPERLSFRVLNDAVSANANWLEVTRGSGAAVSGLALGNATDNPTFTFLGSGLGTVSGGWTFTPPASFANGTKFVGATNQFTVQVEGSATASQSYGLLVSGGTNTTDQALNIRSKAFTPFLVVRGDGQSEFIDGTVGIPGISWLNETTTGWYRSAAGRISGSILGVRQFELRNGSIDFYPGGVLCGQWQSTGTYTVDGAANGPSFSFINDTDTGFYSSAANAIGLAIGGARAMTVNGVSTTGASTGTFTTANKPGSNSGIISWLPVLTSGGTQGYIPIVGA